MIKIDGKEYAHIFVHAPIQRKAEVRDTALSGYMLDGKYHRDISGVYYEYGLTFSALRGYEAEYAEAREKLATATEFHTVEVPYDQTVYSFTAYVTTVDDSLKKKSGTRNIWGDCSVTFIAKEPKT